MENAKVFAEKAESFLKKNAKEEENFHDVIKLIVKGKPDGQNKFTEMTNQQKYLLVTHGELVRIIVGPFNFYETCFCF